MLEGKNIVVLCHSDKVNNIRTSGSGPLQYLLNYLIGEKAKYIFVIEQPHPTSRQGIVHNMEIYKDGQQIENVYFKNFSFLSKIKNPVSKTYIRLKIKDMLANSFFYDYIKKNYNPSSIDYLIGMDSLNPLQATLYRKKLNIQKIVYYIYDWSIWRYKNPILNFLFLFLDKLACKYSDFIWNINSAIADGRKRILKWNIPDKKQITVNHAVEYKSEIINKIKKIKENQVIFSGSFCYENGVHWLPEIAKYVSELDKNIILLITGGGGELEEILKEKIKKDSLANIILTGYINDLLELDQLMCESAIGLAPYPDMKVSTKRFGDVIKIRTYFACGLPVVSTDVTPIAKEILDEKLGIVVKPDPQEIATAIVELINNRKLYNEAKENVLRKAKKQTWKYVFDNAFSKME